MVSSRGWSPLSINLQPRSAMSLVGLEVQGRCGAPSVRRWSGCGGVGHSPYISALDGVHVLDRGPFHRRLNALDEAEKLLRQIAYDGATL